MVDAADLSNLTNSPGCAERSHGAGALHIHLKECPRRFATRKHTTLQQGTRTNQYANMPRYKHTPFPTMHHAVYSQGHPFILCGYHSRLNRPDEAEPLYDFRPGEATAAAAAAANTRTYFGRDHQIIKSVVPLPTRCLRQHASTLQPSESV